MIINKMTIDIEMENDAFEPNKWGEVSRILRKLAADLDALHLPDKIIDFNGQSVGSIVYGGDL